MSADSPLPAFLPVDNPTRPFWRTDPHPLDEHRTTPDLPPQSDIVIIGAGYAGVSIAYHLLKLTSAQSESHPSITILEARQACSGATGRNSKDEAYQLACCILSVELLIHFKVDIFDPTSTD